VFQKFWGNIKGIQNIYIFACIPSFWPLCVVEPGCYFSFILIVTFQFLGDNKGIQKFYVFYWYGLILATVQGKTRLSSFILTVPFQKFLDIIKAYNYYIFFTGMPTFWPLCGVEPGFYFSFILIVTF
jgi:hypothetical protein